MRVHLIDCFNNKQMSVNNVVLYLTVAYINYQLQRSRIPAALNPSMTMDGLSSMNLCSDSIHLAPSGLKMLS